MMSYVVECANASIHIAGEEALYAPNEQSALNQKLLRIPIIVQKVIVGQDFVIIFVSKMHSISGRFGNSV